MESINEGVHLSDLSGKVLYVNDSMRRLFSSMGMSGDIADARFARSEIERRADEAPDEGVSLVRFENGESWIFSCDEGTFRRKRCMRIMAFDVSEEDGINKTFSEQNALLELAYGKLRETVDELCEASYDEALLSAHSKVHDLLGQRFSILHRRLDGCYDAEETWRIARELVTLTHDDLTGASSLRPQEALAALIDTFAVAGVELDVDGDLPGDSDVAKIFVGIIREATTNAILHGDALRVSVEMGCDGDDRTLVVENDGACPQGPVREGGGISGMRREVESVGGSIEYETAPMFAIRVRVPHREA